MNKQEIVEAIEKSNISADHKKEIIAIIRKSNIPTSDKTELIQTINTGTPEEIIFAIMYFLSIAKEFFDKFCT